MCNLILTFYVLYQIFKMCPKILDMHHQTMSRYSFQKYITLPDNSLLNHVCICINVH